MIKQNKVDWRKKSLVYDGLEVAMMGEDEDKAKKADEDFEKYLNKTIDYETFEKYYSDGIGYRFFKNYE